MERAGMALCLAIMLVGAGIVLFLAGTVVVTILSALLSIV